MRAGLHVGKRIAQTGDEQGGDLAVLELFVNLATSRKECAGAQVTTVSLSSELIDRSLQLGDE